MLQADDRPFGLVVDAIRDTEEIVVKPLQKQLKGISVFAGAAIMGDGRVALVLDVLGLAQRAERHLRSQEPRARAKQETSRPSSPVRRHSRCSSFRRRPEDRWRFRCRWWLGWKSFLVPSLKSSVRGRSCSIGAKSCR